MSDILDQVKAMYDEIGTHFSRTRQKTYGNGESSNWPVTDSYLKKLKKGQSVLDIGCGNGKLVSGLPKGVVYTGTDFSQTLLAEAKKLYPKHDFQYGNVVETKHWKALGTYDAVFCVAVLHHIPEKKQQLYVLKQAKKHLKKGGYLYLTVWNLWQEKFAEHHLHSATLKQTDPKWVEIPYDRKWRRFCVAFDIQSLTDLFTEAGLDIQELYYAERDGTKSDIMHGQNLVVVAK
jgi:2-polyprenyl-3-methyl-5-hydroxy-6-metoxy-1,4-benzoquinol methylase